MDRENVVKGLEDIQKHLDDGYSFAICWKSELIRDALAMLKSQQAEIERLQPKTVNPVKPLDVDDDYTYLCDSCKGELFCGDVLRDHFCPSCGGRIEWKDGDGEADGATPISG